MPNQIEFLAVEPALAGVINLKFGPKKFLGQFGPAANPGAALPDPGTLAGTVELIAAALDSGHGANVAPMPVLIPQERMRLQYYGLVQRLMVLSLLGSSPAGWQRAPYVVHLEKSLKTSNAFLLGMLYARVSTEHWASTNGWGQVVRFWHYSVLESSAFNFTAITASNSGNPDFLVWFSNGHWACVEAKGTLGDFDEEQLRNGMRQACKLTQASWVIPGAAVPQVAVPSSHACSLTYFDAPGGNTLEVCHLDPPQRNTRRERRRPSPLWFAEVGDLITWQCAADQFRALKEGRDSHWPTVLPSGEFEWAAWLVDEPIWIGVPKLLLQAVDAIDWTLEALGWLVPELRKWRAAASRPGEGSKSGRRRLKGLLKLVEERAPADGLSTPQGQCWDRFSTALKELADERPGATWADVLSAVWEADLLTPVVPRSSRDFGVRPSMRSVWATLNESMPPIVREWRTEAVLALPNVDRTSRLSVAEAARGLLVVGYRAE